MQKNKYQKYSSYLYNETKPPGTSVDGDLEFYKNLLLPLEGKILEAGVGNGRLLIPFLKYKMDMVGIDNSHTMLELCQKNLLSNKLTCELLLKDLLTYQEPNKYQAIIMPNASFCLIETRTQALQLLNNFYVSLKKGGLVVIDLIFPIDFVAGAKHKFKHYLTDFDLLVHNYSKEINWFSQYTINEVNYFVNDKLVEEQVVKLSWYGVEEFIQMLAAVGFLEIEVIKNYHNKKLLNLKTITFIAKK